METGIQRCIPRDHSRQVKAEYYVERLVQDGKQIHTVMDLGCGAGDTIDFFCGLIPGVRWIGLDIEDSPEVRTRVRKGNHFFSYDGVHIPFADGGVDLIYCNQVLEHVRHPEALLGEVNRVLRPGGYLVGSVSQMEPYHSLSVWNYTPYGFSLLVEDSGMVLEEVRPNIDAITLIVRRLLGRPRFFSRWWNRESPLNALIGLWGRLRNRENFNINYVKLTFCGQFCFLVSKNGERG